MPETVQKALAMHEQGLHKDAFELLQPWLLDPKNVKPENCDGVQRAIIIADQCLMNLDRLQEIDNFLDNVVKVHRSDWKTLVTVAALYADALNDDEYVLEMPHFGTIIDGTFHRGEYGGGSWVETHERDRALALSLLFEAMPMALKDDDKTKVADFFAIFAEALMAHRKPGHGWGAGGESWRLQTLTDLTTVPDFEDGDSVSHGTSAAPVDTDGNPVLYGSPESFEAAKNDGERWRWCLDQIVENNPARLAETLRVRAEFSRAEFGEATLQDFSFFQRRQDSDETERTAGILSLETLADDETIAKLATGIKRFKLGPDDHYIALYRKITEVGTDEQRISALWELARIYRSRRQHPRSAEIYRNLIAKDAAEVEPERLQDWKDALSQIVDNWGRFEVTGNETRGLEADLRYVFRNGKKVEFTAREIKIEALLTDVKDYIRSKPKQLDWQQIDIEGIGWRLLHGGDESHPAEKVRDKYLGDEAARWSTELAPAENHHDRAAIISVPIRKPGAFLVKAEMQSEGDRPGNTEYIVLWLNDQAIVRKPLDGALLYFVADSQTGKPAAGTELDFFGYRQQWEMIREANGRSRRSDEPKWDIEESRAKTDETGLWTQEGDLKNGNRLSTLVTARNAEGRVTAWLGFENIWLRTRNDSQYKDTKAFFISDRPVYRPGDKVEMKVWLGLAAYDAPEKNPWAGQTVGYKIFDPKGEEITQETDATVDAFGGVVAGYKLPGNATLGTYRVRLSYGDEADVSDGGRGRMKSRRYRDIGNFRVEEYKKPEYEVSVEAPRDPVALGDTVRATIKAKYYFGAPVTEATVKYTVKREKADENWYPSRPWDWFYGNGYWWFSYDYDWLPGWARWGVCRPAPSWFSRESGPPEIVAESEVSIGEDGTVEIDIETAVAKEMFPRDNQRYTITAEVVDNSRRTIVGTGSVLVAKEPFKVYSWVDRGYYTPGQKIKAQFQSRRLDGKPVPGDAEVKVFKISYQNTEIRETEVHEAAVKFDEEGKASLSLNAATPGQYRISCKLANQEGGYVFNVYENNDNKNNEAGDAWKFNALELIPDKAEYAPGENVAMRINTNRPGATVLLFVKPESGVYGKPRLLTLSDRSTEVKIPAELRDMPNFFVETLSVIDGKVVTETREIVLPPEKRILNVEVSPSSENYKPGEKAQAKLVVTNLDGTPAGDTQIVVAIYDKSVEYISGGSNVEDIKEFFWKWRRQHHPNTVTSLDRRARNFAPPNIASMAVLEENLGFTMSGLSSSMNGRLQQGNARFAGGGVNMAMEAAVEMEAAPMAAGTPVIRDLAKGSVSRKTSGGGADFTEIMDLIEAVTSPMVEPTVRKNFADTALWIGALETDKDGKAKIELDMPESLTTWKINVWAMGHGTRVGYGDTEVITRKDLIIRMQTPRFLIEKDRCVFSANVHNYLTNEKQVKVTLETQGGLKIRPSEAEIATNPGEPPQYEVWNLPEQHVTIPAGGEARVDWHVETKVAGEATVTMKALTDEDSDAMQLTLPVYVHGMLKQEAFSGYVSPDKESGSIEIKVPEERKPEQTKLTVRFSPTLAASMIDALPYLVDYPYGCTEQTLNRFLPTVLVQKILIDMNVDLEKLKTSKTNLNAQELGEGRKPAVARKVEPVYDIKQVHEMVADGVTKLTNMQCSDGGWGWFGGYGERSSPHLTALVVHGLLLARKNDVAVDEDVLMRGYEWLMRYQAKQVELLQNASLSDEEKKNKHWKTEADNIDAFVFMVLTSEMESRPPQTAAQDGNHLGHAIGKALLGNAIGEAIDEIDRPFVAMKDFLWRDRTKFSLYGVAMYGISLAHLNDTEKAEICVKMLEQYLVQDEENQTAYLNLARTPGWSWWCWHGSEFETQAYYLKLLMRVDPKSPVAPRLVKYLLNNRRHATYWNSTRDTAIVIEAFAEFIKATGEDKPDLAVEVLVDGEVKKTVKITPENLFEIDNTLLLEADAVTAGSHQVELRKKGAGPLYFNVYLENFTLEDPIEKAGLEVKIERRIYKLVRDESATTQASGGRGQLVDMKVEKYHRIPILNHLEENDDRRYVKPVVESGDLIEIELVIETKNDYESIIIEDMKAAGLEPVDVRSGYTNNSLGAYVEFRDERVAMFVYRLPKGKHSVSYRLRAEQPGSFSSLPAKVSAMYAPELKGNSDENKVRIVDKVRE